MSQATRLKEDGNRHFQARDYVSAEALYSKAIIADPTNPALYTNRAMARLKLSLWDSVVPDCETCLRLSPNSMKAHYYLSQAHLGLGNYDDALRHALRAHALCVESSEEKEKKSLAPITLLVLRAKKERWEDFERHRAHEDNELRHEVVALLQRERDGVLADPNGELGAARADVEDEWARKLDHLRDVFDKAKGGGKKRVVPDWAIDDISFQIMVDPLVTNTGKSYERASIMEHLKRSKTDPLTRQPLHPSELRPNLALKEACAEFLKENGWAVDW